MVDTLYPCSLFLANITRGTRRDHAMPSDRIRQEIDLGLTALLGKLPFVENMKNKVGQLHKFERVRPDVCPFIGPDHIFACLRLQKARANPIPNLIQNQSVVVGSAPHPGCFDLYGAASGPFF